MPMSKKKRCEQPEEKANKGGAYKCKKCGLKADNPKKLCKPKT